MQIKLNTGYTIIKHMFFSIMLSFGGGYTFISMLRDRLVDREQLISQKDFNSILDWAQIIPGPVSFNFSIIFTYFFSGWGLTAVSVAAIILPSMAVAVFLGQFIIQFSLFKVFLKGVSLCIPVLIVRIVIDTVKTYSNRKIQYFYFLVTLIAIAASSGDLIVPLILLSILLSTLDYSYIHRRSGTDDAG